MRYFSARIRMGCTRRQDSEFVLITVNDDQTEDDARQKLVDMKGRAPLDKGYRMQELFPEDPDTIIVGAILC